MAKDDGYGDEGEEENEEKKWEWDAGGDGDGAGQPRRCQLFASTDSATFQSNNVSTSTARSGGIA